TLGGGILSYTGSSTVTVNRPITLGPAGGTVTNAAGTLTLSGVLGGSGDLIKAGPGVLNLTGTNTYTGRTMLNAGRLQFTTASNLGTGTIVLNGGTLQPLSGATFARDLTNLGASTINVGALTPTFSGILSGNGPSLTATGTSAGKLTLTGAN